MTQRLIRIYKRLDEVQNRRWFQMAASVVVLIATIVLVVIYSGMDRTERPKFLLGAQQLYTWAVVFFLWWQLVIWLGLTLTYLLIAVATLVVSGAILLLFGLPGVALSVAGIGTLSFTFVMLIRGALWLFRYPSQTFAVAHTVVKESVRLRISVFFIVLLLVLLPTIPLWVGTEEALRYRIQAFISFSTILTFYLAAVMTIFLACGTVAFEIRDRQIWQLLTKPLSRMNYLVGKWIGILTVNLIILIVSGMSIFLYVQYLRRQEPANLRDALEVETEVLAARVGKTADFEPVDSELLSQRVDQIIENDIELRAAIEQGARDRQAERRRIATELQRAYSFEQRSVPAGEGRLYTFSGLQEARDRGLPIKLRYRFHYGNDDTHERRPVMLFVLKHDKPFQMEGFQNPDAGSARDGYTPTMSHSWLLPAQAIGEDDEFDGKLQILVVNGVFGPDGPVPVPGTDLALNFDRDDFEILYTVGGFEGNYFRAMIVMWVKLAFLAMLGIAAATVLSFPVACLMAFTVFLAATMGPFLAVALDQFQIRSGWEIHKIAVSLIAHALVFLFEPFGEIKPTQMLVEGRLIPWMQAIKAVVLLGIVWTGLALGLGFLAFRDKELATYSGRG